MLKICLEKIIVSREKAQQIRNRRRQQRPDTMINWRLLHEEPETKRNFINHLDGHLFPVDPYTATPTDFSEAITAAAEATLKHPNERQKNWFAESEPILAPLRRHSRKLFDIATTDPSTSNKTAYSRTCKKYKTAVQRTKDKFHCELAAQVNWKEIVGDSQKAWQVIHQIEKGSFAHHQPIDQNDMVLTDPVTGQAVSDPASILCIVSEEYTTVLDEINQCQYD